MSRQHFLSIPPTFPKRPLFRDTFTMRKRRHRRCRRLIYSNRGQYSSYVGVISVPHNNSWWISVSQKDLKSLPSTHLSSSFVVTLRPCRGPGVPTRCQIISPPSSSDTRPSGRLVVRHTWFSSDLRVSKTSHSPLPPTSPVSPRVLQVLKKFCLVEM